MIHPEYQLDIEREEELHEDSLTPIYPTTEGMHQLTWRSLTDQCLQLLEEGRLGLQELLPENIASEYSTLARALTLLHRPPTDIDFALLAEGKHKSQQRLALEELIAHQVSLRQMRYQHRQHDAPVLKSENKLETTFLKQLPFKLTGAQQRTVEAISKDLLNNHPMMRLVQGDVGSGKTVVAALAALQAVSAGYQVALMAPTELLSEQHRNNFQAWFEPLGIEVAWLTGKLKGKPRRELLERIAANQVQMIVGTHALFQDEVVYSRLGLVIIDEQHRFGVHQRFWH